MMRAGDALRAAATRIDRLDAEVLLADMLRVERMALLLALDREIDAADFAALVARRALAEPVAYITGRREFWSLDLAVNPDVLIPRPDSETLIEAAIAHFGDNAPLDILDLGTGSGPLLLAALSRWPQATGLGVDRSFAAIQVARGNAQRLGFGARADFCIGDWATALDGRFDLVLANPPYVALAADLAADVRDYEPASALFAGADGLSEYARLIPQLPRILRKGGCAQVEIGATQADAVMAMARGQALNAVVVADLAGRPRCVTMRCV